MDTKKEIRNTGYQVTIGEEESRKVEGYALVFDAQSDGLWFEETIERGALDGVLAKSDVFALLNHDQDRGVLARSKNGAGSLTLQVDTKGLRYEFDAPKTALGDELLENIRRGEVDQSSFAFTVDKDTWERKDDGTWKRTIHKIGKLYDVSPVYNAAYSATTVNTRGKDDIEAEERKKQEAEAEMSAYYDTLDKAFQ